MSGDRKIGNNKEACKAYKAAGRDERNRKRRMRRHLRDNPNDDAGRREFEKQFSGGVGLSSRGKRKLKRAAALAAKAA